MNALCFASTLYCEYIYMINKYIVYSDYDNNYDNDSMTMTMATMTNSHSLDPFSHSNVLDLCFSL